MLTNVWWVVMNKESQDGVMTTQRKRLYVLWNLPNKAGIPEECQMKRNDKWEGYNPIAKDYATA
jgi:hypothetical protein